MIPYLFRLSRGLQIYCFHSFIRWPSYNGSGTANTFPCSYDVASLIKYMVNLMNVIAIDPGNIQSAYVVWDGSKIIAHGILENSVMLGWISTETRPHDLVIEQVRSYGMAVGATVFDTVFISGRLAQAWGREFFMMPRMDVKMHLCHMAKAKDSNIRQALIDRFGEQGTKKSPGLLYGIKKDEWAALALAVTYYDKNNGDIAA